MLTEIMFVNKIMFLMSISKGLKFTMLEYLSNNSKKSLVNSINKIVRYYNLHGLHVCMMFVDPEFQLLEEKVVITVRNTTGACDHLPEV